MSTAAARAPTPLTTLRHRASSSSAATTTTSSSSRLSGNAAHLANLESLFRNRGGGAVEKNHHHHQDPLRPVVGTRSKRQPLLRLPSFLKRTRGVDDPSAAAAAAMSPRRLERLLQPAAPSPRGDISASWRRLHGSDAWRGLLDPLHPDLRREIVRYGEFVDAAYAAFLARPDASPSSPSSSSSHLQSLQVDPAYRVTAPLFATASAGLPAWVAAAAPWAAQRTSLVGYVAVCDSPTEIRRMGRRDVVIALRGTCTVLEWAENVRAGLVPATTSSPAHHHDDDDSAKVECGFWNLYKTAAPQSQARSLSETVVAEIRRLLDAYKGEQLSITVTGHSLGAALAVLIADELAGLGLAAQAPVAVFSFGGPRVGDEAFARRVEARGARVLRVVNAHDVVPRFPPSAPSPLIGGLAGLGPYADVGRELRLDSRASPYLRPDADAACCHDLEAYIHLVDGFVGSHCPFRDNAKRGILRLPENQGGNVKQLYISKAKDMRIHLDAADIIVPDMVPGNKQVVECVH
ncbi:hypothetical protein PR202_gb28830 [Eleusine coracana subsp. coracana]|uniref:Fungal lipase-type domain-containing protein n=1 Tax=Eleusine coracana subsp. coracana TaxID=191504 RepID=A0AAV5FYE3_ELECO|nr:hypothetical protein QOZ80_8BG0644620 [Eleusine coracana subsp. coracana]GJN39695.1 hypothetical protein PR202_gb28830 [Eleusine coracana subsp. coracana]